MPISPENAALYPPDWPAISRRVKEDAGWCCEGSPEFAMCRAAHGEPHPGTGSIVVLTVGHLDHNPANCERSNLRAWCQRCHLAYDAAHHAQSAAGTRAKKLRAEGQQILPGVHA